MSIVLLSLWLTYAQSSVTSHDTSAQPEYFDEPQFTVAGVTDNTYRGAHGSDAPLRSAEALTKAAAALKQSAPNNAIADGAERQGKPLEAVREYQRAAEADPSEPNLFDWGTELLVHRAAEPAAEIFAKGHRLHPASVRMLLGFAVALYAKGDYEEAARRFFEACDLNPNDPAPYLFLAKVQNRAIIESDGYLDRFARFAQLRPDDAQANYYYAVALANRHAGDHRVKMLLDKSLGLDPKFDPAHLELGILYSERGDYKHAISEYLRAVSFDEAHYRLAQAYSAIGDKSKAQQELRTYNELSKKSDEAAERERKQLQQFVITLRH
jgi:tetratricopeptide (TPR) repeat protein